MDINVANGNVAQDISSVSTKKYKEVLTKRKIYKLTKRIIDVIGAILGIVLLIPITIGIYVAKIILKDKVIIGYLPMCLEQKSLSLNISRSLNRFCWNEVSRGSL